MRYSADHKAQTRDKLLCSSSAIAKRGGFAATGVDGLMKAIGLSGGAFYSHFPSKNDLFSAIVERELSQSLARLADSSDGQDARARLRRCLDSYLSLAHVQHPDRGCALPALGAEIARAPLAVREQAQHWLLRLQQAWAGILGDEQQAWALLAQCVGALLLARMLAGEDVQQALLEASRAQVQAQLEQ